MAATALARCSQRRFDRKLVLHLLIAYFSGRIPDPCNSLRFLVPGQQRDSPDTKTK